MRLHPVSALRSVTIGVPDVAAAERFYVDVWGLEVSARDGGTAYLRGTGEDHHILALVAGEAQIHSATFRVRSAEALDAVLDAALREGASLVSAPGPASDPAGGVVAAFRDPQGRVFHLVHGDRTLPPLGAQGCRPVRLAHININATDVDATTRFFEAALGFRMTDRSKLMSFVSTNADHHAVVIAEADRDGLNHIAFLQPDVESLMRASGRMVDHGWPIGWGVGRHGPGDNVFAYFVGPAGYVIEYTAEVLQVDDAYVPRGPADWVWPPGRTDQWGIAPPKPDHVKQAQLAIPFVPAAGAPSAPGSGGARTPAPLPF